MGLLSAGRDKCMLACRSLRGTRLHSRSAPLAPCSYLLGCLGHSLAGKRRNTAVGCPEGESSRSTPIAHLPSELDTALCKCSRDR